MNEESIIKFPSRLTDLNLEKFLAKPEFASAKSLSLPKNQSGFGFGNHGIAFQYLLSWVLQSKEQRHLQPGFLPEDLIKYPHSTAALGTLNFDEPTITQPLNDVIDEQHDNMAGTKRGALSWHIFFDQGRYKNPFFYESSRELQTEIRPNHILASVIEYMMNQTKENIWGQKRGVTWSKETYEVLGTLFAELFLNSDEHGSFDENRVNKLRGARLVYTNALNIDKKFRENMGTETSPLLKKFIERTKKNRILEIGIVDSGLGFYERWMGDTGYEKSDEHSEYKVFQKCFAPLKSSSVEGSKGMGLPRVLTALTELQGFIRVRTGKLNLCRDLGVHRYEGKGDTFDFFDWKTGDKHKEGEQECPSVKGTAITIIIPEIGFHV